MKHTFRFLIGICAVIAAASPARGAAILSITPTTVFGNPGDIGDSFDVVLTNTGVSSLSVAGFQFEVTVASTDVTFTGVDITTAPTTYIFAGNSLFGPSIILGSTGQTVDAGDNTGDGSNASVGVGQTVALGRVIFNVANPATLGLFLVTFTGGPLANNISDAAGNSPALTLTPGNIDLVPEPSSLALTIAGAAALAAAFRKRRV